MKKFSEEVEKEICKKYNEGVGGNILAKEYLCSTATIRNIVKRNGFSVRTYAKKYMVNLHAFDVIDTEEKAYWLGFILADGCIYKYKQCGNFSLEIKLKSTDIRHLEKLRDFLESTHNIKTMKVVDKREKYKGNISLIARLRILNDKLCQSLIKLGVVPRKGGQTKKPTIPCHLNKHFWRGMVDGDGCIRENVYSREECGKINIYKEPTIQLCGDIDIMVKFREYCESVCIQLKTKLNPSGKIWVYTIRGPKSMILMRHFYDGASIFLDRKKKMVEFLDNKYKDKLDLFLEKHKDEQPLRLPSHSL